MSGEKQGWARVRLTTVAQVAVLALLSHAEYAFGVNVLGLPGTHLGPVPLSLALAVPLAVDTYVIAALRAGRDVVYAMSLIALSVAAGTITAIAQPPQAVQLVAAAGFGAVMSVVLWRVHALDHADQLLAAQVKSLAASLTSADRDREAAAIEAARLADDLAQAREQAAAAQRETDEQRAEVTRLTGELRRAQAEPRPKVAAANGTGRRVQSASEPAPLQADVLELGKEIARELEAAGKSLTRDALTEAFRSRDKPLSNNRAGALLAVLRAP